MAAIANAAVDTILHHGGGWLKRKYGSFFDINKQGKFFWFTKYPVDGYHIFKSIRICSYLAAISISLPHGWLWFTIRRVDLADKAVTYVLCLIMINLIIRTTVSNTYTC